MQHGSHRPEWALAIHGGAGAGREEEGAEARADAIRAALNAVLEDGAALLAAAGSAVDVVEGAVRRLEDCELFNAGRGSVFDSRGAHELEASIMDGRNLQAGAVAGLTGIANPVRVARLVMERSAHVFLHGDGAERFAAGHGVERVASEYFRTERRWKAYEEARRSAAGRAHDGEAGTVGAVALDGRGNLAAATSTGGMTFKAPGRIGDSPIIGAGTYAGNGVCAVSCTGHGEYFIRATAARSIAALLEYGGRPVEQAVDELVGSHLTRLGGEGGAIAVDADGRIAIAFNTEVMLRGTVASGRPPRVGVTRLDTLS